jgi:hypothetical protein
VRIDDSGPGPRRGHHRNQHVNHGNQGAAPGSHPGIHHHSGGNHGPVSGYHGAGTSGHPNATPPHRGHAAGHSTRSQINFLSTSFNPTGGRPGDSQGVNRLYAGNPGDSPALDDAHKMLQYADQSETDQKALDSAYDALKQSGVNVEHGATLSPDAIAALTPAQKAAYDAYVKALVQLQSDIANYRAAYAELQLFASDPQTYGNMASDAIAAINDELPDGGVFNGPAAIDPAQAQRSSEDAANVAAYWNLVSAQSTAVVNFDAATSQLLAAQKAVADYKTRAGYNHAWGYAEAQDDPQFQALQEKVRQAQAAVTSAQGAVTQAGTAVTGHGRPSTIPPVAGQLAPSAEQALPPLTGAFDKSLAALWTDASMSTDLSKAKTNEVVQAVTASILWSDEAKQLQAAADQATKDTNDALTKYGANSPQYLAALAKAQAAQAAVALAVANANQTQAQYEVYATDPAYKDAINQAAGIINGGLQSQGLQWAPPKAAETHDQALKQLSDDQKITSEISQAEQNYQDAARLMGSLPANYVPGTEYKPPQGPSFNNPGTNPDVFNAQQRLAHDQNDALYAAAMLDLAQGNQLFATANAQSLQQQLGLAKPGTPQYKQIQDALTAAQGQLTTANSDLTVAQAGNNLALANVNVDQLNLQKLNIQGQALSALHQTNPYLFDPGGFVDGNDHYSGKLKSVNVVIKNNQLYAEITYEHKTLEIQLTFPPGQEPRNRPDAGKQADTQWAALNASFNPNTSTSCLTYKNIFDQAYHQQAAAQQAVVNLNLQSYQQLVSQLQQDYLTAKSKVPYGPYAPGHEPTAAIQAVKDAKDKLDAAQQTYAQTQNANAWFTFLSNQDLTNYGDPAAQTSLQNQFFEQNPGNRQLTFNQLAQTYSHPFSLTSDWNTDDKIKDGIAKVLNVPSSDPAVSAVADQIKAAGGPNGSVQVIPVFFAGNGGSLTPSALFQVTDGSGNTHIVDDTGRSYSDISDYQQNNRLPEAGTLYLPQNLNLTRDAQGNVQVGQLSISGPSEAMKIADGAVGIVTSVATVLSFVPVLTPVAAPIAMAGGVYLGVRGVQHLEDMTDHGQSLASMDGVMTIGQIAASFVPEGAGAVRAIGLWSKGMEVMPAMQMSIRAINTADPEAGAFGILRAPWAADADTVMNGGGALFTTARVLDGAGMAIGTPLMLKSGYDTATQWDDMSGFDKLNSGLSFASGLFATGMGARDGGAHGRAADDTRRTPAKVSNTGPIYLPLGPHLFISLKGEIVYNDPKSGKLVTVRSSSVPATDLEKTGAQLDANVRDEVGQYLPEGLAPASSRIGFVDDATFKNIYKTLLGKKAPKDLDAFTISNRDGDPLLIVSRNGSASDPAFKETLLHEIVHYYTSPEFANYARQIILSPSDRLLSFVPDAPLSEGMAQYLAWKFANGGDGISAADGSRPGSYEDYLSGALDRLHEGGEVKLTYPYATRAAEKLIQQLGEPAVYAAVFSRGGDDALSRLKTAVDGNLPHDVAASDSNSLDLTDYLVAASARVPASSSSPTPSDRFKALVWNVRWRTGSPARKAGSRIRKPNAGFRSAPTRSKSLNPLTFLVSQSFKARTAIAGRLAPKVDDYFNQLVDTNTGNSPHMGSTPWSDDVIASIGILGKLKNILGDVHAHSRPYERRWNYLISGNSRFLALTRMTGTLGRILIGDIPQYCGFGHYSHMQPDGLTLDKSQLLDKKNLKTYNWMVKQYLKWDTAIRSVNAISPGLGTQIHEAAMRGDWASFTAHLATLRSVSGGKPLALSLRSQVHVMDLRRGQEKSPFFALHAAMSLTGFNPGDPAAADYIRTMLRENPNRFAFLGEITLQKELVAVMLGKQATVLHQPEVQTLLARLTGFANGAITPADLRQAITDFRQSASYSYVQAAFEETHGVGWKLDKLIEKLDGLTAKRASREGHWDGLIAAEDGVITTRGGQKPANLGEIGRLENEKTALETANGTDERTLAPLLTRAENLAAEIDTLNTRIGSNNEELAANNRRLTELGTLLGGLGRNITGTQRQVADLTANLGTAGRLRRPSIRRQLDNANARLADYIADQSAAAREQAALTTRNGVIPGETAGYTRRLTSLQNDAAALKGRIDPLKRQIADGVREIDARTEEIARLREENRRIDEDVAAAGSKKTKLGQSKTDDLSKIDGDITPLTADINTNAGQFSTILTEFNTQQRQKIDNLRKILQLAQETGLGIVIHCDWGEPGRGSDHRPEEQTTDYVYLEDLVNVVKPYSQPAPGSSTYAKIVLAHTGFGRLTKPDAAPIAFTHDANSPLVTKRGSTETMPVHIAKLYWAREQAPNIQFDISWNDVGERYVKNIDMMDGLTRFAEDHPDAVLFGTDTVKPVRPQQYLQAFTTLLPYFMRLANKPAAHELLWRLLRGNFDDTMAAAGRDVNEWTKAQLPAQASQIDAGYVALSEGQSTFNRLAREQFDQILTDWQNSPRFGTASAPITAADPSLAFRSGALVMPGGRARRGITSLVHGSRPPGSLDTELRTKAAAAQARTSAGAPASPGRIRRANAAAAARTVLAVGFGLGSLAIDHLFGLHSWAKEAGPASSATRQMLFLAQFSYREYVRKSWDALFEQGDVSNQKIKIFLNRTLKVGKAIGVGDEDLAWVIYHTKQFQTDLAQLNRIASPEDKDLAVMGAAGLYQIDVDRAIGVQAGSFDLTSTMTRFGRAVNDAILGTIAIHETVTVTQLMRQIAEDWHTVRTGQLSEDFVALALMAAVRIWSNRSGAANLDLATRQELVNRLQVAMLTALAARGATNAVNDAVILHALTSAQGFLPHLLAGIAVAADTGMAYQSAKAAYYEWARQTQRGVPNRGTVNTTNQLLVSAIFISAIIHAIMGQ